jgi:hypothetical protein
MKHQHDQEMEQYLRGFQPRAVRSLKMDRPAEENHWRRLAAAAVVLFAVGTSVWYAQVNWPKVRENTRPQAVQGNWVQQRKLNNLQLTRLALTDQEKFNEVLAEQSRESLPNLRGERSTLGALARE